jgi:hypothetical protein
LRLGHGGTLTHEYHHCSNAKLNIPAASVVCVGTTLDVLHGPVGRSSYRISGVINVTNHNRLAALPREQRRCITVSDGIGAAGFFVSRVVAIRNGELPNIARTFRQRKNQAKHGAKHGLAPVTERSARH